MQENNFEKKVQQKMDELSLSPSAEVWQKLSVNIARQKRDRRFFIIIFLLLLTISSTVYLVFKNPSNKEFQKTSSRYYISGKIKRGSNLKIENKANKIVDNTNSTENSGSNVIASGAQHQSVLSVKNEKPDGETNTSFSQKTFSSSKRNSKGEKNNLHVGAVDKVKKVVYNTSKQLNITVDEIAPGDFAGKNFNTIDSGSIKDDDRKNKKVAYLKGDFIIQPSRYEIAGEATTIKVVQLSDSFVQMLTTANKKQLGTENKMELKRGNAWKFGVNFSLGASTTQAGLLGIIGPGDGSKSSADQIQNTPGGVPTGSPIVYYPSQLKTGAGILIGGFAQKSISTRSSIALGLNFKMLSSSMNTGARVDSIAFFNSNNFSSRDFFYRNGNQQNFKNHFYFIELPVSIKLQLNKQKKAPVYLTTGINFGRLINSNALQFDVTSGNYYRDNALLNKTQLSGSLGVLFSLNANDKNPLLLGPGMQYGFNKMADAGLYKTRHYSFFGLTLQKTLGKK